MEAPPGLYHLQQKLNKASINGGQNQLYSPTAMPVVTIYSMAVKRLHPIKLSTLKYICQT